jgi:hypothetical protein
MTLEINATKTVAQGGSQQVEPSRVTEAEHVSEIFAKAMPAYSVSPKQVIYLDDKIDFVRYGGYIRKPVLDLIEAVMKFRNTTRVTARELDTVAAGFERLAAEIKKLPIDDKGGTRGHSLIEIYNSYGNTYPREYQTALQKVRVAIPTMYAKTAKAAK